MSTNVILKIKRPKIRTKKSRDTGLAKYSKGVKSHNNVGRKRGSDMLTSYVADQIAEAVRIGMPPNRAAMLAGIPSRTFTSWKDKAKKKEAINHKKYKKFMSRINGLEKERELEALKSIQECGKGGFKLTQTKIKVVGKGDDKETTVETTTKEAAPQWQAMAWYLERLHKKIYGKEAEIDTKSPEERAKQIASLVSAMDSTISALPPLNGSREENGAEDYAD